MAGKRNTAAARSLTTGDLRLLSAINERLQFAGEHGVTFEGKRDLYAAAGYPRDLGPTHYWQKYKRNGVARRLVSALPNATWRAGAEIVENDNPDEITAFEAAWIALEERLNIWDRLRKADILAQLGRFSVLLIGAAGEAQTPMARMRGPDGVLYLRQYSERDVEIKEDDLVGDTKDPRFGQPNFYTFKRITSRGTRAGGMAKKVHWTRVVHIADEAIEDDLYSDPRLGSVYNWLDDLEKVAASGSEAFWRRVVPMLQAKLDAGVTLPEGSEKKIEQEIDKLIHGLRRYARVTGVNIEEVGSTDVAAFDRPVDALIGLIVAGYGLPKRILMGSERGELASAQDRSNWEQNIKDRRSQFAETQAVKPLVGRLTEYAALPKVEAYETRWPDVRDLDEGERLDMAVKATTANKNQGETVFPTNEIRDRIMGYDPLEDDEIRDVESEDEGLLPGEEREPGLQAALARLRRAKTGQWPYLRYSKTQQEAPDAGTGT